MNRDLILFALLGALLFLPGLGNHDLWNPDEPRYFQVCREMSDSGTYLVPHLNDRLYSQKPPLLFWSMCGAAKVLGFNETAARLPSAVSAIASILVVYLLGRLFFTARAARLAALAYATSVKVLWQGHTGQIDMLLSCLVLVSVYFWARSRAAPGLVWFFYVFAGLATLAKGPVGLLPALLSIMVFLAVHKDWQGLRQLRVGRGLLLWAAVVLLWLVPALLQGGETYAQEILFKQNVTRYANPWHHFRPWYYYLTVLPADFFPWFFFLPAALFAGLRYLGGETRRSFLFACTWMAVTLVFFSLSPAKRTVYILSMYPAMALMVGAGLDVLARAWKSSAEPPLTRRWLLWPVAFSALLTALIAAALPWAAEGRPEVEPLGKHFVLYTSLALACAAVGGACGVYQAWRRRPAACGVAFAAGMIFTSFIAMHVLMPRLDAVKSSRELAQALLDRAPPDEPYAMYPRFDAAFLYYTQRFAVEIPELDEVALRAFAARDERVWLLIRRKTRGDLVPPLGFDEVAGDTDAADGWVLLRSSQ